MSARKFHPSISNIFAVKSAKWLKRCQDQSKWAATFKTRNTSSGVKSGQKQLIRNRPPNL